VIILAVETITRGGRWRSNVTVTSQAADGSSDHRASPSSVVFGA
jgi:hypothetical protein